MSRKRKTGWLPHPPKTIEKPDCSRGLRYGTWAVAASVGRDVLMVSDRCTECHGWHLVPREADPA